LERIKQNSPPLSFSRELRWPDVRDGFAAFVPVHFRWKGGNPAYCRDFVEQLERLIQRLGHHYKGPSKSRKSKKGDPEAFNVFFKTMEKAIAKPGPKVVI
jgi:hypothetical protein